ncbi:MAG: 4-hydroxyphenylpyruvate dioxygenase, partial [Cyanobacteria bacterium J06642_3]
MATKNYSEIIDLFTKFGFVVTGRHRSRNILLLQQGELKFVVNAEMKTDASSFESIHGSGFCGTAFRVQNSDFALREAVKKGAEAIICADYGLPAIRGIGGSKIYLIDSQTSEHFFANFFETTVEIPHENPQVICVDHITYNVFRGNMEAWAKFYEHVFNFQEIRNFDIKGKKTGLRSKALISPCGKIRIPLNEPQDDQSQIAEFLKEYNGEGIQHIALSCHDIYSAVDRIKQQGVAFQNTPDTYYDLVDKRIPNHQEDVAALKKLKVLIDGNKQEDGILLQIFTKEVIGPIFFEFIERKGNKGFGEGNFQALFESIELDQIRRGVLSVAESFSTLSSAELVNYANPALAQVAFGGEEKGIGIVEFEKEHSLCQFLKQFSALEISAASLSIFSILLHRYTSQEQFKLRQYQISEEICQLDLACNLTEKSCFRDLLESARQLYSDGFSYQDNLLDFNQHSNVSYSLAYFVLGISDEYINTLTNNHLATSEMCLMLDGDSHAYLAYDQALFDHNFIANFIRHFGILLDNIQSNYDRDLEFVGLTSQADITLQCDRWQTPSSDYGHRPIYRHFEQYAHEFPESIAAKFGDKQINYEELNFQANQLARYLIKQNVQPQDCIGVFVEPGIEILVAILAIHKINAVYVPIDTEYPLGRVKTVIDQVSASIIIGASARLSEIKDNFEIDTINLPAINLSLFDRSNLNYSCSLNSISHIFFTSGTTGTPKGVVSSHSNLIHYIFAAQEKYRFGAEDSFLSATRYTFSISLLMLLLPLICGGQVNIITLEQLTEPKLLAEAIERSNFFHLGPSILKILLDFLEQDNYNSDRFSHVKHASSGGDMIPTDILNRLNRVFAQAEVYAIYGSSEISCMGCTYLVPKELEIEQTLVGKPFNNVGLRVLDQHQRVVPVGVKGEIYFSGQGITQGYLNLPHRTATQYVWLDDERFYRTGDIGRLTPQGNLQVLGRDDSQVQIRGMRIELGEIESNLNLHPAIGACVVIVKEDKLGGKQLVAYLIPQNQSPTSDELRRFLQSTLPQYMIPAHFVSVAEFPLNPNGKIDRRALADLKLKLESQSLTQPRTATQEQLVKIWSEVLKLDAVGIEDNFFELGGHSLLATQIISRIRETLEVEVAIASFFASPTIAALAKYIDTNSTKNSFAPILPIPRQDKIPLSLTQERLWFLYKLEPDSSAYNIPLVLEIKGVLQINTLERAIAEIVRRHETLRTNFDLIDNTPLQLISPSRDIPLKVVDLRSLSVSEGTAQLQELMETEIHRPFELTQEALLRTTLFQQTPDTQVLLVMMHHIVSDGWSLEIFTKELATIYAGIVDQQSSTLPELSIQYADFAHWQREYLQGEIYEAQLNYWQQQLAGLAPLLELPTDKTRPAIQSFHGGVERFNLSPELTSKLQNISKESGATLFMTLLASFATLLSRYSNSRDIAIGSPIANRNRSEIESLIGFFVNTLVLRTNLEGEPSFEELLQQVRQTTLDAYSHSDLQFDQLVEILQPERSLSHNPLFQVMFVLQNGTVTTKETSNLSINPLPVDQITAQFDLTLSMEETDRGLTGFWQYNSDLFETETIQRLADNFLVLLEQIVTYPEKPVTALPLITQAERQQLLVEWNDTQTKYPQDKCIHQLFEEQVAQTPDAVALVFEEQQLTYRELNTRANQLAYYLRSLGVKSEVLVGICLERSIEMVVGILAILKAGGAYVPLDPAYPSDRLAFIVEETQVKVLLTIQSLLQELPPHSAQVVCLDTDSEIIQVQNNTDLINSVTSDNLAYVMYTSGSTGRPKGVSVIHRGVVRLVKETNYVNLTAEEVFLMLAPISFDASTFEIWGSLLNGARLIIFSDKMPSPITLGAAIRKYEVTTLWLTAALFHLMVDERLNDLKSLHQLLAGGDVLSVPHVQKVLRKLDCQLINGYGPTENTTFTCCYRVTRHEHIGATVPIGLSIANTQVYVLDKYLQP